MTPRSTLTPSLIVARRETHTVSDVFCNQCGHRNPAGANFCSSCGGAARASGPTTDHHHLPPGGARATRSRTRSRVALDELSEGGGHARGQARPERRLEVRPRARRHPRRSPSRQRHLPRRHHRVPPPRRGRAHRGRATACATSARSTAPTSTASASTSDCPSPTATSCRSASSSWCSSPAAPGRGLTERGGPGLPVDRRGPVAAQGGVPRRHHLQDPVPREPGPARPRAHAVGLPQVLRHRRRAAALDPAPAAGALPAR